MKRILVTGGAGFVGSHLIDRLLAKGYFVVCIDDLSLGRVSNIGHHLGNGRFKFIQMDMLDRTRLRRVFRRFGFGCVFHMAANSDIQKGWRCPETDLEKTFLTTFAALECMRLEKVKEIVFASSSAIYGELDERLKENSGPLFPASFYGAAKLASEGYIAASCAAGMKAWIIRFPNVIGERATHGVMYDFVRKLKKDPRRLVILGNGKQKKPYLYVKDVVDGILFAWRNSNKPVNCFNLGVTDSTSVSEIAGIVTEAMGLENVRLQYTGGAKGWVGDIPRFSYDVSKLAKLGWKAKKTSTESVRHAIKAYLGEIGGRAKISCGR